jgi:hypothetical protein
MIGPPRRHRRHRRLATPRRRHSTRLGVDAATPAAVKRLRTVVEAGNRASLALLAGAGRMSHGRAHLGVRDVTVELAAA